MKLHLTDITVSRLHSPGTYHDEATPAFGLRVGKNRKTWFVVRGRQRLRTKIGLYPAISLSDARKKAKQLLLQAPIKGERLTLNKAFETFKREHTAKKKERTRYDYERVLNKYFVPVIGTKKLVEIAYEDVTAITDDLSDTPSEQAHVLAIARTFFRWCVRPPRRYIPYSPLEGIQIKLAKARDRVLSEAEFKAVWNAAVEQGHPHGTVVQLLALTGQRRSEIANLRRPWINEKERTITLPSWLTKNKRQHTFPYGDLTAAVLETVPRLNTTDLLFPSAVSDDRPLSGFSKFKQEMKDGVIGWRLHDLRRTFRTQHAMLGTSSLIGERLINHITGVQTDVERIYDRYKYLPEMRNAVAVYEQHISQLLAA